MKSADIRKTFLEFFAKHNHEKVSSSSLIPAQDPTLLFTNAGMNQFKDVFLGKEKRSYVRATTSQKCVRAGGKHNDLDNVGFTKRHLTFFEMLGNFSFGDYFKKDAIALAWDLLTNGYGIKPENMYVSVYEEDDEAFAIWEQEIGVPKERIMRFGKKDNFWQMGDTGPCGPCTEIYIDLRPEAERANTPVYEDFDQGRLLEIWNLVFMQFDRQQDGTLIPLKQTGVDTGAGLERVTCILQGKESVFHTDLFTPLIQETEKLTGVSYAQSPDNIKAAFHVLADHVRSTSFIIADGGSPSNEGRGYVLRKIIRRAALFAQKLTAKNIFPELAKKCIKELSPVYPELAVNQTMIVSLLTSEIDQFATNLIRGQNILQDFFTQQKDNKIITGDQAFKLYDTYGFPLEVTILASEEKGFSVDAAGFETAMEKQRALSGKKMKDGTKTIELPEWMTTHFVGYEKTATAGKVLGVIVDDALVTSVKKGQDCTLITDESPFFAATGGQVDDSGWIALGDARSSLEGLVKLNNAHAIGAKITAPADIKVGDTVQQAVDQETRRRTMNNHTATHMLQAALIELLGKQIKQSGSVVTPEYLRFDFTYHKNLSTEELKKIENRVNEKIRENITLSVFETNYKDALSKGVIAIFGEKYNPECVRVVDISGFSAELCGGTHVPATGNIGVFKITDMTALSAGNRRIFAVTGIKALELAQDTFNIVKDLSQTFKAKPEEVISAVCKQGEHLHQGQQQIKTLRQQLIAHKLPAWQKNITSVNGVPFLHMLLEGHSVDELKDMATTLNKKQPGFYLFASNFDEKSVFYAFIAPQYAHIVDIKKIATALKNVGLQGGGKQESLQGGGPRLLHDLAHVLKGQW